METRIDINSDYHKVVTSDGSGLLLVA